MAHDVVRKALRSDKNPVVMRDEDVEVAARRYPPPIGINKALVHSRAAKFAGMEPAKDEDAQRVLREALDLG